MTTRECDRESHALCFSLAAVRSTRHDSTTEPGCTESESRCGGGPFMITSAPLESSVRTTNVIETRFEAKLTSKDLVTSYTDRPT